ncbi:MAG: sigma-70 family RNA polymerase sigma factor [Verrucomicrobiales bacterium]|nr:sigma-70 family RNA polymerase sigma factor [Verrucomicrobiales bacterium]
MLNPGQSAELVTTHWSVIQRATGPDDSQALDALEELARRYHYPVYAEVRRQGHDHETAEDLTQAFFERLLAGDFLARADREKGRFRNYLFTVLNHFLADQWRYQTRQRRGGGQPVLSLNDESLGERYALEPADPRSPAELYERRFALALLESVLSRLERDFTSFGSADLFRKLQVFLTGDEENTPGYAELGTKLDLTEGAVKAAVYRLRRRYRELLRDEIARIVATPEEVEDELRHLFRVLAS